MDTSLLSERQREFFRSGKTLDIEYRMAALRRLRDAIYDMQDEIASALQSDLGKGRTEGYMCETGLVLSELGHTLRKMRKWARRKRVHTPLAQFPARSFIIPEPYGNVLIMSPWNYPFLLCISPLVSAVAAGNSVLIKPSAYSPATGAVIARLVSKCFCEGHVAVVEGGREVNSGLLEQKFDYIFFTGSKTVGRLVMEKAAAHLTPVTLELGGKSPVVVDASSDLKIAAARIVFGKYLNCGQTCVAPDYVLVHESIADEFVHLCREAVRNMYGEYPLKNGAYGKIVNRKHYDRLCSLLDECDGISGPEIVYGGEADSGSLRISPTAVLFSPLSLDADLSPDRFSLMRDEIFGPIMPVIPYSDLSDVIEYVSARPRPLAAYFFTGDRAVKKRLLRELHFGGGCVNDTIIHLATDHMPFGGVGESGMGNYHGRFGFDTFSHMKSIVDKAIWLDIPMRYQPYGTIKDRLIRLFLR